MASVLITKGALRAGASIVAGHTWCRVRQMQDDKGKPLREALPGTPVFVTGWKDLPSAGDELLEARSGEDEAKKAVSNRKRDEERKRLMADVEQINAKRKEERQRLEAEAEAAAAAEVGERGEDISVNAHSRKSEFKTLNLLVKADVSGTVEAVVGSLEHIGNKEAGVKIIHTGVGEISESDVSLAEASGGEFSLQLRAHHTDIYMRSHHSRIQCYCPSGYSNYCQECQRSSPTGICHLPSD